MSYVVANFPAIIEMAADYGLPVTKKRAIVREYLQTRMLQGIYRQPISRHCRFIGGTALRLLYGLDRFSEDMDFNVSGLSDSQVREIISNLERDLTREGLAVSLYENESEGQRHYEIRFKDLLAELAISPNLDENLTIKFDFQPSWQKEISKAILVKRYGFLATTVTLPLEQLLVQKMVAYLTRPQTQPRDIYDIVWLLARNVKIDRQFALTNGFEDDLITAVERKYVTETKSLKGFGLRLRPFLLDERNVDQIKLLSTLTLYQK